MNSVLLLYLVFDGVLSNDHTNLPESTIYITINGDIYEHTVLPQDKISDNGNNKEHLLSRDSILLYILIVIGVFILILIIGIVIFYIFYQRKMKRIVKETENNNLKSKNITKKKDKKSNKYEPMMIEPIMITDININNNNNNTDGQYAIPSTIQDGNTKDNTNLLTEN